MDLKFLKPNRYKILILFIFLLLDLLIIYISTSLTKFDSILIEIFGVIVLVLNPIIIVLRMINQFSYNYFILFIFLILFFILSVIYAYIIACLLYFTYNKLKFNGIKIKDKRVLISILTIFILVIFFILITNNLNLNINKCENSVNSGQCYHSVFCNSKMPSDINKALEVCNNIDYPLVNCYTEIARRYNNKKSAEICKKLEERLINDLGKDGEIEFAEVLDCGITVSRGLGKMYVSESKEFCLNPKKALVSISLLSQIYQPISKNLQVDLINSGSSNINLENSNIIMILEDKEGNLICTPNNLNSLNFNCYEGCDKNSTLEKNKPKRLKIKINCTLVSGNEYYFDLKFQKGASISGSFIHK